MSESIQQIRDLFTEVEAYINAAEEKLAGGNYVELGELGPMVDGLCARVLGLPRPIGDEFQESLDQLSLSLNHLKGGMEAARKRLSNEAKGLQKRQKALKIYSAKPQGE